MSEQSAQRFLSQGDARAIRSFMEQAYQAIDEERRGVARELREGIGQLLSALMMRLEVIRQRSAADTGPELDAACELLAAVQQEILRVTRGVHPSVLDDLGLAAALEQMLASLPPDRLRVESHMDAEVRCSRFEPGIEVALYRIAQRAVRNVLQHSRASALSLVLRRKGAFLRMIVEDDGVGCDVGAVREGLGLSSIRQRARLLGGWASFESIVGGGASLCVALPVCPAERVES